MRKSTQGLQPVAADGDAATAAAASAALNQALAEILTLGDLYVGMLEQGAASFAALAQLVAAATIEPPTAVIVHCTAGKDRTGVSTALLLDVAGAERSAIIADYAASQQNLAGPWADGMFAMVTKFGVPLTDGICELISGSPASAIEQAFAWVDARGGSAAYLQSGGLTNADLEALRTRLIDGFSNRRPEGRSFRQLTDCAAPAAGSR